MFPIKNKNIWEKKDLRPIDSLARHVTSSATTIYRRKRPSHNRIKALVGQLNEDFNRYFMLAKRKGKVDSIEERLHISKFFLITLRELANDNTFLAETSLKAFLRRLHNFLSESRMPNELLEFCSIVIAEVNRARYMKYVIKLKKLLKEKMNR